MAELANRVTGLEYQVIIGVIPLMSFDLESDSSDEDIGAKLLMSFLCNNVDECFFSLKKMQKEVLSSEKGEKLVGLESLRQQVHP